MIFKTGRQIPFYNPDHGPTYDVEEAKPPVPIELLPITERWLDPHFGLVATTVHEPLATVQEREEMDEEEALRQAAAERFMNLMPDAISREAAAEEERRLDAEDLEQRRQKKMKRLSVDLDYHELLVPGEEDKVVEAEPPQFDRPTLRMNEKVARGMARDPCTLVTYTIDTIREMTDEVALAEKDMAAKKK